MVLRITKEFKFEMAHALLDYDGPCKNIHGHSYRLLVTLRGRIISENNAKKGMVFDFSDLKTIVQKQIIEKFDHALVLNKKSSETLLDILKHQQLITVDFQPTCENLCAFFALQLQIHLPDSVELHHVKLYETASSSAEWFKEDN
jgi:6-pyruvoyltetrahydropterin/6-carboxytetrahydropterin synthase